MVMSKASSGEAVAALWAVTDEGRDAGPIKRGYTVKLLKIGTVCLSATALCSVPPLISLGVPPSQLPQGEAIVTFTIVCLDFS